MFLHISHIFLELETGYTHIILIMFKYNERNNDETKTAMNIC